MNSELFDAIAVIHVSRQFFIIAYLQNEGES